MRFSVVALLCGIVWAATIVQGQADEVDDLLAGKRVVTDEEESRTRSPALPSLDGRFSAPLEPVPLADGPSWEAVGKPSHTRLVDHSDETDRRLPAPSTSIAMVPEPQAIALGALALLYFLVFFRRRHLA